MSKYKEIEALIKKGPKRIKTLTKELGITRAMVHRYLKKMLADDVVKKLGRPPKVYYSYKEKKRKAYEEVEKAYMELNKKQIL